MALSVAALPMTSWAAKSGPAAECTSDFFGVAAQVVRVEPNGATLDKIGLDGKRRSIGLDGLICAGESLPLLVGGPVQKVELLVRGRKETLVPPQKFNSDHDLPAFLSQSLSYLSEMIQGGRLLKAAPDVPGPTAARGNANAAADPAAAMQIRPMRLLRELPRQKVAAGIKPLISWRDGAGPYVCRSVSEAGKVLSEVRIDKNASWCAMRLEAGASDQLNVVDARGQQETWNMRTVAWSDVPRPAWITAGSAKPAPADQTAWALWLWKSDDKAWRLQALGMLDEVSDRVWLAGYLRDSLLAEDESFAR